MKVLVVGGGGREHALVWKIARSPLVDKIYCAPGNGGIAELAECIPIDASEKRALRKFASENAIDLTVVGPEAPLCDGITDFFQHEGLKVFGVDQRAARLEGSKVFAKELMHRHGIPTADFRTFQSAERAKAYVEMVGAPVVVKADGLAAGKGVIVSHTVEDALGAVNRIMIEQDFGTSGDHIIIEKCLAGEEASVLAFTDGRNIAIMPSCQDHKPVHDGDTGPNTGGMGAYSPAPVITPELESLVERSVIVQTIHAMKREGRPYQGVLYAGLMMTEDGPQVLEFNCRLGDPEMQPLAMRLKSDIVPILLATVDGTLDNEEIEWDDRAAVCVIIASGGYPAAYRKGYPIEGLDDVKQMKDVVVFHSGTKLKDGKLVTDGGRVLGVTALGNTIVEAQDRAYEAVGKIHFENCHYRTDIADKALRRST